MRALQRDDILIHKCVNEDIGLTIPLPVENSMDQTAPSSDPKVATVNLIQVVNDLRPCLVSTEKVISQTTLIQLTSEIHGFLFTVLRIHGFSLRRWLVSLREKEIVVIPI